MSIMDQVKKNLREWYSLAADRTGEMAKISVRMYDKYGISREIERQLSELGSYVYHAVEQGRTEFAGDEEFTAWIERIKSLEKDLNVKVAEIDEIRVARQQKQAQRERDEAANQDADHGTDEELGAEAMIVGSLVAEELVAEELVADDAVADEVVEEESTAEDAGELLEAEEAGPPPAAADAQDELRKDD